MALLIFISDMMIQVAIDGYEMAGKSMQEVASRLLGPSGSLVMVKFRRIENDTYVENTIAMDRRPMKLDAIRKVAQSITS